VLLWPEREAFFIGKRCASAIENVFEWEGDVGRLEGVLGEETGPKYLTIDRVKSVPKRSVSIFFREVARVNEGKTVAYEIPVIL
jgi:hypothetical protein